MISLKVGLARLSVARLVGDSSGGLGLGGGLQAELDHLLWHRVDTRSSSKLRQMCLILVILVIL